MISNLVAVLHQLRPALPDQHRSRSFGDRDDITNFDFGEINAVKDGCQFSDEPNTLHI